MGNAQSRRAFEGKLQLYNCSDDVNAGLSPPLKWTLWKNLWLFKKFSYLYRSTQRAVLQKSCSTVGILLGKLIQFYVLLAR